MASRSVEITANDDRTTADVDETNEALVFQDEIHTNIHRGKMYSASYLDMSVADDGTIEILVQVASDQSSHLRFGGSVGGDCEMQIYKGTTFSSAGTSMSSHNRNGFSSNTASTTVTHSPTLTGDGTQIYTGAIPGGTFIFSTGAQTRFFEEWILETSSVYLMRVTNRSASNTPISIVLDFYEP